MRKEEIIKEKIKIVEDLTNEEMEFLVERQEKKHCINCECYFAYSCKKCFLEDLQSWLKGGRG